MARKTREKEKFSLGGLFYNNHFVLPFAIVASLILWMSVNITQNASRERTISDVTVNITTENTAVGALGLDVVSGGMGEKVNVKVSGSSYTISALSASDILVSASLSEVTAPGVYEVPLTAVKNSAKTGDYSIVSITPSTLEVTFDHIDTKRLPVQAVAEGASAADGLIAESAVVTDTANAQVEIRGPRTEMNKLASVQAVATVNKRMSATESFDAKLVLLDENGEAIDPAPFTLSFTELKITVPISKSRELPLRAAFTNAPAAYKATPISYTLNANSIRVLGQPEIIDSLEYIELSPIDFDNISANSTQFSCTPKLPNGVKSLENLESVTVTINIGAIAERTFDVSNFVPVNIADNLQAGASQALRNVKIAGPEAVINALDGAAVYAEVDMSGKPAGEHTVNVRIRVSGYDTVWQVGTYSVLVTASERQ
ncbi:MAG: hypothetical protein HFE86_04060 [Clostridiales bacterium]|nr:hypothetical protein [Clostridiales bacterium]